MTRKGRLEEIFSKALHGDDSSLYFVSYRDFEVIAEVPLDPLSGTERDFFRVDPDVDAATTVDSQEIVPVYADRRITIPNRG